MKSLHLLTIGICLLTSCNTTLSGYPFKIQAVYQAQRSKLQITVNAEGHVPAGSDISETYKGTVLIDPLSDAGENVQLIFTDNDQVIYTIDSRSPSQGKWGFRDSENSLNSILAQAGYLQVDSDEIAEIVKVIGAAFAGPKASTLDGQAKHLKVIKVDSGR